MRRKYFSIKNSIQLTGKLLFLKTIIVCLYFEKINRDVNRALESAFL